MAGLIEARAKIEEFFNKELKKEKDAIRVMEVSKIEEGWKGRVEITEDNVYLKKLGYPPVYDKNIYEVKLDEDLNMLSYSQKTEEEEAEEESEE